MRKPYVIVTISLLAGLLSAGFLLWVVFNVPGRGMVYQGDLPDRERTMAIQTIPIKMENDVAGKTATGEPEENDVTHGLYDPQSGLNRMAARTLRMGPDELDAVNNLLDSVVDRIRNHEMRSARVSELSDERIVFTIAGSDEWAQSINDSLRNSLARILGDERTNTLFLLGNEQLVRDLNHFGARDQEVVFEMLLSDGEERGEIDVSFRRSCPVDTREVRLPVKDSHRTRWLELTPPEFEHLLYLIPPRR